MTAWYAASAFGLIALVTCFLYWDLVGSLDREDDQLLADKTRELRMAIREEAFHPGRIRDQVGRESMPYGQAPIYVRVLSRDGAATVETPGMAAELPAGTFPPAHPPDADPGPGANLRSLSRVPYRAMASGEGATVPGQGWVIQVAVARADDEELLRNYRWLQWVILAGSFGACVGVGHAIARRGIRAVRGMVAMAGGIRSSTLDERMEMKGLPVELQALAQTFNEVLERLEQAFARLSRFSADIAHELRTPIQNLRGEAEVALGRPRSPEEYRSVLESGIEECQRLSRLIDSLLFLARAEDPSTGIAREPLDLQCELETLRDFYEASAADAGVRLSLSCAPDLRAELDRTLFQRAVGNLLTNALAHTPAGGGIAVEAIVDRGALRVRVSDTGAGIPAEHLPHVLDRFYRADGSRSTATGGTGLGLAIVKGIAELHGGTVEIESRPGAGTSASLLLPLVRTDPR